MIPWPIALLTVFDGILATIAGSGLWRALTGIGSQAEWTVAWFAVTAATTCGLPLLKDWARKLAIGIAVWIGLVTLAYAALLVKAGHPGMGLAASCSTAGQWIIVRYLRRPAVKKWFTTCPELDSSGASPLRGQAPGV